MNNKEDIKNENVHNSCNLSYIKKLAIELFKINVKDVFMAMVIYDTYHLMDDINKIKMEDIKWIEENYNIYLKDTQEPLINPKWLKEIK